jgi:septum formation protein
LQRRAARGSIGGVNAMSARLRCLPPLVLASASPRRLELLRQLGLDFAVVPGRVEELAHEDLTARELCLFNARQKALAVARQFPDALVLGADTLVYLGHKLFGKPADLTQAEQMLAQLQGQTHQVVTGVCLLHLRLQREKLFAEISDVTFRSLTPEQIRHYLSLVNPLDKAGAYAIQEHGNMVVAGITGSCSNVVGLPLERLQAELAAFGGLAEG